MTTGMEDTAVAVLREIRDEIHAMRGEFNTRLDLTNTRLDETNARLNETNARLDETNTRLGRTNDRLDRVVEAQIRMGTALAEMQGLQRETAQILGLLLREVTQLGHRLDHVHVGPLGQQVRDHEARLRRVEHHLDLGGGHGGPGEGT